MTPLQTEFTEKGFTHVQEWRDETHAIYRRWKSDPNLCHFEAVRIIQWPDREIHGTFYAASEGYPSSTHWGGVVARTVGSLEKAHLAVQEMKSRQAG